MSSEKVILVDEQDHAMGEMDKLKAHEEGKLHRAFSIFLFNSKGELLLQQRADHKYHSAGLWTNTCCSHPRPGEDTAQAAARRLKEEMGLQTALEYKGSFVYRTGTSSQGFENGLTEHEFDHVFFGKEESDPIINTEEVKDFRWISLDHLMKELKEQPQRFTFWFRPALEKAMKL